MDPDCLFCYVVSNKSASFNLFAFLFYPHNLTKEVRLHSANALWDEDSKNFQDMPEWIEIEFEECT